MDVKKIFFDMDGVLADFDRGVVELCHMKPLDQLTATDEDTDAVFAVIKEVSHFYGNLEPIPGALELFNELYDIYGDKLEILTGIPKPRRGVVDAADDKINWCARFLPQDIKVNIVFKEEKKNFCTGSDCILIDDLYNNIQSWLDMGGTGILHKNPEDTREELCRLCVI